MNLITTAKSLPLSKVTYSWVWDIGHLWGAIILPITPSTSSWFLKAQLRYHFSQKHPLQILPLRASHFLFYAYMLRSLHGLACIAYINFWTCLHSLLYSEELREWLIYLCITSTQHSAWHNKYELCLFCTNECARHCDDLPPTFILTSSQVTWSF